MYTKQKYHVDITEACARAFNMHNGIPCHIEGRRYLQMIKRMLDSMGVRYGHDGR